MAVNNFSKEWVAGDGEDVTVGKLWICLRFTGVAKKSAWIRKKGFDESARVAKVIPFFRK